MGLSFEFHFLINDFRYLILDEIRRHIVGKRPLFVSSIKHITQRKKKKKRRKEHKKGEKKKKDNKNCQIRLWSRRTVNVHQLTWQNRGRHSNVQ